MSYYTGFYTRLYLESLGENSEDDFTEFWEMRGYDLSDLRSHIDQFAEDLEDGYREHLSEVHTSCDLDLAMRAALHRLLEEIDFKEAARLLIEDYISSREEEENY